MNAKKIAVAGALAAAATVGLATNANAAMQYWSDANYNYGGQGVAGTDCMVHGALAKYVGVSGTVQAFGQVPCNTRHAKTTVQVTLNVTTPTGVVAIHNPVATYTNSYGTTATGSWIPSPAQSCKSSYLYQTVVTTTVDNASSYATTGTPKHLC